MFGLTGYLAIALALSLAIGGFGVKGCMKHAEENKRLRLEQAAILQAVQDQKEVREKYEKEKSRLDNLSGPELDAELDRLLSGSGSAQKGFGPR